MKVFMLAVSVMLLTGMIIGLAGWYTVKICSELTGLLKILPDVKDLKVFGDVYGRFENRWYGSAKLLKAIVGKNSVDAVEKGFLEMGMRYLGEDMAGYHIAKEQLEHLLQRMQEGEKLTWDTVL